MISFWQKLKNSIKDGQAIYALAPMAGITDSPFRQICKELGADIVYSEMASASALFYSPKKTLEMLVSTKKEIPYVIQLFGSNPAHFASALKLLSDKKTSSKLQVPSYRIPQGFDINFGCPVKKVQKQGAGAVLMNNFKLAREIVKTVVNSTDLPVSIKCRSRAGDADVLKFLDYLKGLDIKAVMIHGRSLSQGHSGPVDYGIIKKARNFFDGVILANGGAYDLVLAQELLDKTKADGIGIGQGALGRPWIFNQLKIQNSNSISSPLRNSGQAGQAKSKTKEEILKIILKHAKLVEELKGETGILEFRKHLCWYVNGWLGAKELRQKFIKVKNYQEIKEILN